MNDVSMQSLKWNCPSSRLEPPNVPVWVFTSDLTIRKSVRKTYSKGYNGFGYVDFYTGESSGKVLFWAYT